MKCTFVADTDVNIVTLPEQFKPLAQPREARTRRGKKKVEWFFPAGTTYESPMAYVFVDAGQAVAADEECVRAAKPMTDEERRRRELEYKATAAGVLDPADRELFFAGVITGYQRDGERMVYAPGPLWDKYQAMKKAKPQEDEV